MTFSRSSSKYFFFQNAFQINVCRLHRQLNYRYNITRLCIRLIIHTSEFSGDERDLFLSSILIANQRRKFKII